MHSYQEPKSPRESHSSAHLRELKGLLERVGWPGLTILFEKQKSQRALANNRKKRLAPYFHFPSPRDALCPSVKPRILAKADQSWGRLFLTS